MIELDVKNMTCGGCVRAASGAVNDVDPGAKVQVDLEHGRVQVDGQRSSAELIGALQEAGYPSVVAGAQAPAAAATTAAVTAKKAGCCCR